MAQIYASVEHVTLTITDAGGSASANLTKGQDETKCVPFYSVRVVADVDDQHNDRLPRVYFDDNAGTARVNAELPYGTDADDVVVEIFVVEFDSAYVKVQQVDYSAFTGASLTPTFTSVSAQSAAFILNSYVWDPDGQTSLDDFNDVAVQCRFDGASTSQALLSRRASGGTINGTLYVVEALDGEFSVQHSEIDVTTATDYSGTATVSSVTGSKTFLVHSYESSENADDMRDAAWIADLQDSTTVRVRRSTVLTPSATATHSVATVTCGASEWDVQRGEVDVTATSTTESITAIDQSRTCIVTQSGGTSGASSASTGRTLYTVGGIIDDAMTAVDFSANDTLRFQRFSVATATTTLVGYEVVQFSDGAVTHNLTADDVESASGVSTPSIGQVHGLSASDVQSTSEVDAPAIGQVHGLTATSVESASQVSTPALGQVHALTASGVESVSEVSTPTLGVVSATVEAAKGGFIPQTESTYKRIERRKKERREEWKALREELLALADPQEVSEEAPVVAIAEEIKEEVESVPDRLPRRISRAEIKVQIADLESRLERVRALVALKEQERLNAEFDALLEARIEAKRQETLRRREDEAVLLLVA